MGGNYDFNYIWWNSFKIKFMKRIQRRRTKGWKMPENAVYVGRPTRWGNPYKEGMGLMDCPFLDPKVRYDAATCKQWRDNEPISLQQSVDFYRSHIKHCLKYWPQLYDINKLLGHDLACWCPIDKPCHCDVLIEILKERNGNT